MHKENDTPIQDAFNATRTALWEVSNIMESIPSDKAQERARKIKAAISNSAFMASFNVVPVLLDNLNRAAKAKRQRKARIRSLWINNITLGLTYKQRRELRELSAL